MSNSKFPDLDKLKNLVSRISTGSNCIRGIATIMKDTVKQVLQTGTSTYFNKAISYHEINNYFRDDIKG